MTHIQAAQSTPAASQPLPTTATPKKMGEWLMEFSGMISLLYLLASNPSLNTVQSNGQTLWENTMAQMNALSGKVHSVLNNAPSTPGIGDLWNEIQLAFSGIDGALAGGNPISDALSPLAGFLGKALGYDSSNGTYGPSQFSSATTPFPSPGASHKSMFWFSVLMGTLSSSPTLGSQLAVSNSFLSSVLSSGGFAHPMSLNMLQGMAAYLNKTHNDIPDGLTFNDLGSLILDTASASGSSLPAAQQYFQNLKLFMSKPPTTDSSGQFFDVVNIDAEFPNGIGSDTPILNSGS